MKTIGILRQINVVVLFMAFIFFLCGCGKNIALHMDNENDKDAQDGMSEKSDDEEDDSSLQAQVEHVDGRLQNVEIVLKDKIPLILAQHAQIIKDKHQAIEQGKKNMESLDKAVSSKLTDIQQKVLESAEQSKKAVTNLQTDLDGKFAGMQKQLDVLALGVGTRKPLKDRGSGPKRSRDQSGNLPALYDQMMSDFIPEL